MGKRESSVMARIAAGGGWRGTCLFGGKARGRKCVEEENKDRRRAG